MSAIEDKVNDLSLLLVMLGESDEGGIGLAFDLIASIAKEDAGSRLATASDILTMTRDQKSNAELIAELKDFTTAAQTYFQDPASGVFPNETDSAPDKLDSELLPDSDPTFVIGFIETHVPSLEELEIRLLQNEIGQESESTEDLNAYINRYLHTVKGDAGAVGLIGIQRVTHEVEEILLNGCATSSIQLLLDYRKWVSNCLSAFEEQEAPPISSAEFLSSLALQPVSSADSKQEPEAEQKPTPGVATEEVTAEAASISPPTGRTLQMSPYSITGDAEILSEFVVEANDQLNTVEEILLEGKDEYDSEDVGALFRAVHSLKGGSAYFSLQEITETSHVAESLMDKARDGEIVFDQEMSQIILRYVALQRELIEKCMEAAAENVEVQPCQEAEDFYHEIKNKLDVLNGVAAAPTPKTTEPVQAAALNQNETPAINKAVVPAIAPPAAAEVQKAKPAAAKPEPKKKGKKLDIKTFVKVDTNYLDRLVDTTGETIIYTSMLIRTSRELLPHNEFINKTAHQVEKFLRDLQELGMSMRLVPIKGLFQKMSRLVWDTSKKIGKEVNFEMDGEDTELDRNLIDKLADPLMHMVRNSIDHGIELPDARVAAGKPKAGRVKLSASHEGGSIFIKIQDDGAGLDAEKLRLKAVEKGIIAESEVLTEQECYQLIFAAGFSTAAAVTDLSGRGVGMDVVRKNIENMRGSIHIESELGKGTTFSLEVPLTLAIIDGIEVQVGQQRYIIPTHSIVEFMQPHTDMISRTLNKGETFQFRGQYLPIFRLYEIFGIEQSETHPENATMIVIDQGGEQVALMVDKIVGQYQTVIKSLGKIFEEERGISGCAIMSNGTVALILDMRSLLHVAREQGTIDIGPVETAASASIVMSSPEANSSGDTVH